MMPPLERDHRLGREKQQDGVKQFEQLGIDEEADEEPANIAAIP